MAERFQYMLYLYFQLWSPLFLSPWVILLTPDWSRFSETEFLAYYFSCLLGEVLFKTVAWKNLLDGLYFRQTTSIEFRKSSEVNLKQHKYLYLSYINDLLDINRLLWLYSGTYAKESFNAQSRKCSVKIAKFWKCIFV